ncbi:MAG: hypothetical protein H6964_03135 [Chromatiaceae bacterium]|nr:hypothetical protein [Gammaproteobacteria bacterium]MCP5427755.1 hypothetical protein [Chromatiaceae bacterium]MCP5445974.1 hypothetical protein [Chromatiaceae bacterium]
MNKPPEQTTRGYTLKEGPVIYQQEESLEDDERLKKDLTLAELNHVFKLYLGKLGIRTSDISILGQFSVIFNDSRFSHWHSMSLAEQDLALTKLVLLPPIYGELIEKIGELAGDKQVIKWVTKDAYQNAIDSFSHSAFVQQKYKNRFPGFKVILFLTQVPQGLNLAVVDNGFGELVVKPKKSFTGQTYDDDIMMKITDWIIRLFTKQERRAKQQIAYTGGQGMALKKIKIELGLDYALHFFTTGAVFELKLKNYF